MTSANGVISRARRPGDRSGFTRRRSAATMRLTRSWTPALVTVISRAAPEEAAKTAGGTARSQLGGAGIDSERGRNLAKAEAAPVMHEEGAAAIRRDPAQGVRKLDAK